MLERTIGAFAAHPRVDDILVVIHPDDAPLYEAASPRLRRAAARDAVSGGARRQDSVRAGLEALAQAAPSSVLIHDAARPFVDAPLIARVIDSLDAHDGALPCLPVTDTLKRASEGRITGTVERDQLWRAQTPQGFRFDAILAAHRAASCRCRARVHRRCRHCRMVRPRCGAWSKARRENRKLTTAEDLRMADEMLRSEGTRPPARSASRPAMTCMASVRAMR